MNLNVEIEYQPPTSITSKDIDDTWLFLNNRIILATQGKNLNELFDNQQQFMAAYNEWEEIKRVCKDSDELEYLEYMKMLEARNTMISNALNVAGISFDASSETVNDFIKSQSDVNGSTFPFAEMEIIGWDSSNFILRDSIYYSMTGKRAVFFLARLDK